ncbi:MAG: NAD(P)H-hydrate epimerase, partial [Candidatus Acidiferrum sp.]
MKALTAAEMREVDRLTTERFGIPGLQLMENAGRKAANAVLRAIAGRSHVRVCVLCGKGNNGGDGFVVARRLREQKHTPNLAVRVVLFGKKEDLRGDAAINLTRWIEGGGEFVSVDGEESWRQVWPMVCESNVIVDAMLGTGLRGGATGAIALAIGNVNERSR